MVTAQNSAKKDTILYVNGDCQRTEDFSEQTVSFHLQGDTIYIEGLLAANYCGEHYLTYEQWEDSIAIKVYDKYVNDVPCVVNCLYPAQAKIGDCTNEYYKVNIQNHIVGRYEKNAILKRKYQPALVGDTIRWSFLDNSVADAPLIRTDVVAYGDTVINDMHYKHLGVDRTEQFNNYWNIEQYPLDKINALWRNYSSQELFEKWSYCIRESADAARIYIYDIDAKEETLLSDLSLNEGDSIDLGYGEKVPVASVSMRDGLKYVFLSRYNWLMETLGAVDWTTFPFIYGGDEYLNCFKNDVLFFVKEDNWFSIPCGCDGRNYAKAKEIEMKDFFVEVVDNVLNITFANEQKKSILLYNLNGTVIQELKTNSSDTQISTRDFQSGMYVLKVTTEGSQNVGIEKIIIH